MRSSLKTDDLQKYRSPDKQQNTTGRNVPDQPADDSRRAILPNYWTLSNLCKICAKYPLRAARK